MQHETKFVKVEYFSLIHKQACVRLPTITVNLILLAFAAERHAGAPLLLSADRAAIDRYSARPEHSRRGVWWANDVTDRRSQWCIAKNGGGSDHYIIIIIAMTMFMVLSSYQSHCESSPGSSDECRLSAGWPSTLTPSQSTWAVSPPKIGSYRPHPPSPLLLLLSP